RRHRLRRAERSLRRAEPAGTEGPEADGQDGREGQPERRRHRPRPPARLLRRPYHRHPAERDGVERRPAGPGDHVYWSGPGYRDRYRARVTPRGACLRAPCQFSGPASQGTDWENESPATSRAFYCYSTTIKSASRNPICMLNGIKNYKGNVMDKKQSAFLISTLLMIASCATIVTGTSDTISFNSEPDGATVTVAGRVIGKPPVSVVIDKDTNQAVTFEKDGYKTFTTQLSTTTNPWFL